MSSDAWDYESKEYVYFFNYQHSLYINVPHRILILRMTADGRYPVKNVAQTFEKALQIKYATIILQHREDDPQRVVVQCVPSRQLESALRRLNQEGYEGPPEPSADIAMTEGQEVTVRYGGNNVTAITTGYFEIKHVRN